MQAEKIAVLISCFDWYETRLEPIKEILENRGFQVTILTSDFNHQKKKKIKDKIKGCEYVRVKPYKKNLSISRIISHRGFAKEIERKLEELKPNFMYVLLPPNTVGAVCGKYKQEHSKCKFVIDIIDLWPESMPLNYLKYTFFYKVWKNYRDKTISFADYIFMECQLYQEVLGTKLRRIHTEVLPLYKIQKENVSIYVKQALSKQEYNKQDHYLNICYLGSINYIIDIDAICNVIRVLSKSFHVKLHIIGDGERRSFFLDKLKINGYDYIYYGEIYDELKKACIMTHCDFGLNMMKQDVKVGLTIKSIDYLSVGLPFINNIKGDTWKLVEQRHVGINVSSNGNELINFIQSRNINDLKLAAYKCYQQLFTRDAFQQKISHGIDKILM